MSPKHGCGMPTAVLAITGAVVAAGATLWWVPRCAYRAVRDFDARYFLGWRQC